MTVPTRDPTSDPLIGQIVDGRYTIRSLLGRGGMGSVYRAWQKNLNREVALKLLVRDVKNKRLAEIRDRFTLEAATAAKLKHPHTITVFDFGISDVLEQPLYYISMELLEGRSLSRVLGRKGRFSVVRAVNISRQIASSLQEAHGQGVVHRDMKPGNVMLLSHGASPSWQDDFVKVLDFGLAKTFGQDNVHQLTRAGTFLGSPRYVAPEQINGQVTDGRTDIYALGCLLFRMVVGTVPFDGENHVEILQKHLHDPIPNVQNMPWPDELKELMMSCLAKEASQRPSQMTEVIESLNRVQKQLVATQPKAAPMEGPKETNAPAEEDVQRHSALSPDEEFLTLGLAFSANDVDSVVSDTNTQTASGLSGAVPKSGISQSSKWPTIMVCTCIFGASLWALFQVQGFGLMPLRESTLSERAPEATGQRGESVRLRITSTPPSSVFRETAVDSERESFLGITPIDVSWTLTKGEVVHLRFERQGYGTAHAQARVPESATNGSAVLEVEAILQPLK